ncbi:hypothetical protein H8F24_16940 [Synechococcus sp. CBW1002]|uniref:hypothetical protein n=1 Tax=Synechococcus sp. CBW1002 TaxID=1353134 RepID=UPI0018CEB680|nr:hypothetical protein [Synechococcus sp. CBW1002]QPN59632.1 hypothetical protein H8F24_16940 [Synechococcus sp. CBW1002]
MNYLTDHPVARRIFNAIRDRPYAWAVSSESPANNCYVKGIALLQRLGVLGYGVRGRVGEICFGDIIPAGIQSLHPSEFLPTHFWVEIWLDGGWHVLDCSYDPPLAEAGLVVNQWDSNRTCFEITKVYSQEDIIAYQMQWEDQGLLCSYFELVAPFACAFNQWLENVRVGPKLVCPEPDAQLPA